jgi:hypothetical protein
MLKLSSMDSFSFYSSGTTVSSVFPSLLNYITLGFGVYEAGTMTCYSARNEKRAQNAHKASSFKFKIFDFVHPILIVCISCNLQHNTVAEGSGKKHTAYQLSTLTVLGEG